MSIARVGHVGLTVPDLDLWTDFFREIVGLQVTDAVGETVHLTSSLRWTEIRLRRGDAYGVDAVGLDVSDPAALDELVRRAPAFDLEVEGDAPTPYAERVVRVAGPGVPVLDLCSGARRAPVGYNGSYPTLGPRPRKLGHVTFLSSDFERTARILADYLGFRLSDTVMDDYHWYRCNRDHHGIGLGRGEDVLHHYAFELTSFQEFQHLGDHLVRNDRRLLWGPGRHGPGNNLFTYFLDPEGGMVEMYSDILQIEDDANWQPTEFTAEQAGNAWGPGTIPPDAWLTAGSPYLRGGVPLDAGESSAA